MINKLPLSLVFNLRLLERQGMTMKSFLYGYFCQKLTLFTLIR